MVDQLLGLKDITGPAKTFKQARPRLCCVEGRLLVLVVLYVAARFCTDILSASPHSFLSNEALEHERKEGGLFEPVSESVTDTLNKACLNIEICISIHVFLYQRVEAATVLLENLQSSDYTTYEWAIPLVIHVDAPSNDAGTQQRGAFKEICDIALTFNWTFGPKLVDFKQVHYGLRDSWLSAWVDPRPQDIMIAFEDDIKVNLLYFQWLMKVLKDYNLLSLQRDPGLLGISLSPMLHNEMRYPFRRWTPDAPSFRKTPVYLNAAPSSWGVLYFGDRWREFLSFALVRAASPHYPDAAAERRAELRAFGTRLGDPNLWLPDCWSNSWSRSWKRFMVDVAFGRGAYMLYPRFDDNEGLATSMFLAGDHTDGKQAKREASLAASRTVASFLLRELPSYYSLPLVDLHGNILEKSLHIRRGHEFLRRLESHGQIYTSLLQVWRSDCILDPNSHPRAQGRSPLSGLSHKYLVSLPCGSFEDQMLAVVRAAVWAHILQRTLILLPLSYPMAPLSPRGPSRVSFADLFDPGQLDAELPGLDYMYVHNQLSRDVSPARVIIFDNTSRWSKAVQESFEDFGWNSLPKVDVSRTRDAFVSVDKLQRRYGGCEDDVLAVAATPTEENLPDGYDLAAVWTAMYGPVPLVQRLVKHTIELLSHRPGTIRSLQYDCLHLHLSDCQEHVVFSKVRHQALSCRDDSGLMHRALAASSSHYVYLSSNRPERLSSALTDVATHVVSKHDVKRAVEQALDCEDVRLIGPVTNIVDQRVCARAELVVFSASTTYTEGILHYRHGSTRLKHVYV